LGISFSAIARELGVSTAVLSQITGVYPDNEAHLDNVVPMRF